MTPSVDDIEHWIRATPEDAIWASIDRVATKSGTGVRAKNAVTHFLTRNPRALRIDRLRGVGRGVLDTIRLAMGKMPSVERRDVRQEYVAAWVRSTFGDNTMSLDERASRFLEEAVELAQSLGMPYPRALAILDHVYDKLAGDVAQEVGGVGVTLLALCAAANVSADQCERAEFDRVLAIPAEHFRERHNAKVAKGIAVKAGAT